MLKDIMNSHKCGAATPRPSCPVLHLHTALVCLSASTVIFIITSSYLHETDTARYESIKNDSIAKYHANLGNFSERMYLHHNKTSALTSSIYKDIASNIPGTWHENVSEDHDKRQIDNGMSLGILQKFKKALGFKVPASRKPDLSRKNVLLIFADDLRAELSPFIDLKYRPWLNPDIYTPNIAELASQSAVFLNAYVQSAQCNPSRTSILTGRRPNSTGIISNYIWFRSGKNPNIYTIPQYFREHNFTTVGLGKLFHLLKGANQDFAKSWSKFVGLRSDGIDVQKELWAAVSEDTTRSNPLMDQMLTQDAFDVLSTVSEDYYKFGKNFFVAVGYRRPHRPWVFPEKFLQYYPLNRIPLPPNPTAPHEMPFQTWLSRVDVKRLTPIKGDWPINTTIPHNVTRILRRAYYSCVSYIDHEIGLLIKKAKALRLLKNTIVVLLGDHGYQLGEHGLWGKRTNFEEAIHTPLLLRIPGMTEKGKRISNLVEFLDLFPTLVELAGLPKLPACPKYDPLSVDACVEGRSLVPVLKGSSGKDAVFSQFPCNNHNCTPSTGYSVRTDRYRYTEWWHFKDKVGKYPLAQQLFDIVDDPLENYNRARDPKFSEIKNTLARKLRLN